MAIAPSIMPISTDLHVKCPFYLRLLVSAFYKKLNKKKSTIFYCKFFIWYLESKHYIPTNF